jgi:hypothetical protein
MNGKHHDWESKDGNNEQSTQSQTKCLESNAVSMHRNKARTRLRDRFASSPHC